MNKESFYAVLTRLFGQQNILTVPVILVELLGDLEAAMFLAQCIYWSGKSKRTDGFFYKTHEEWREELHITEYVLRAALKKCENYLTIEYHMANGLRTGHYKVNWDTILDTLVSRSCENQPTGSVENHMTGTIENQPTITETTTETTTLMNEFSEEQKAAFRARQDALWLTTIRGGENNKDYPGIEKYPEDVQATIRTFCDTFNFIPPKGKQKAFWIQSARDLMESCGAMGDDAIKGYRKQFEEYMATHKGLAPHTVSSPASLVNPVRGWVAANSSSKADKPKKSVITW